eukprot:GHVP01021696.1.p1 GENE.GHVP01021696.1~~GHVP01021696.1.p1  ORF type:complete len:383 (+),score=65.55 GHVP01021696.1:208-1356(+)
MKIPLVKRPGPLDVSFLDSSHKHTISKIWNLKNAPEDLVVPSTGKVHLRAMRDNQIVGELHVGTPYQMLHPIFDTGSTNLLLVSDLCRLPNCKKVKRFSPNASSTFAYHNPRKELRVAFGTGQVEGIMGRDDLAFGTVKLQKQLFGLIKSETDKQRRHEYDKALQSVDLSDGGVFSTINFEGLVGLAFPRDGESLLEKLPRQADKTVFSFVVSQDDGPSYFILGSPDPKFFQFPMKFFGVARPKYWELELESLLIGGKEILPKDSKYSVILDSGTAFNSIPSSLEKVVFSKIYPKKCNPSHPEQSYPIITYRIEGEDFEVEPKDYVLASESHCRPAYMILDVPSSDRTALVLGVHAFLPKHVTQFEVDWNDLSKSRVGIAKK